MARTHIIAVLLLGSFLSGCAEESSVICFALVTPAKKELRGGSASRSPGSAQS